MSKQANHIIWQSKMAASYFFSKMRKFQSNFLVVLLRDIVHHWNSDFSNWSTNLFYWIRLETDNFERLRNWCKQDESRTTETRKMLKEYDKKDIPLRNSTGLTLKQISFVILNFERDVVVTHSMALASWKWIRAVKYFNKANFNRKIYFGTKEQ